MKDFIIKFFQWTLALYNKSPLMAVIVTVAEIVVVLAVMLMLYGCSPNFFVQKNNSGSSISTETVTKIDSSKIAIPIK